MEQLYFLSIVLNGFAGFLFLFGDLGGNDPDGSGKKFAFVGSGFRLIIGILALLTGILKLLYPMEVLIFGDLLPALAGIIAGFMLIYGFYRERSSNVDSEEKINRLGESVLHYKKAIGIVLLVAALLHFLLPRALFL